MQLSIHHLAELELDESAEYYSESKPGLGKEFLDTVDAAMAEILENPYAYELLAESQRRKVIRRFPFSIYYTIYHETIRILSIAHQSRSSHYWKDRS